LRIKSKEERQQDLENLRQHIRRDAHSLNRAKAPEYLEFCRLVRTHTPLGSRKLFSLWYLSAGFDACWNRTNNRKDRETEEVDILTRCLSRGISGETALKLIEAWWERHFS
jgi:hypothetical protein